MTQSNRVKFIFPSGTRLVDQFSKAAFPHSTVSARTHTSTVENKHGRAGSEWDIAAK